MNAAPLTMTVTQSRTKKLNQLAKQLGGRVEGEEVAVGSSAQPIYVSFDGESAFWLASEAPLYTIKRNRPKPVPIGTEGEDGGWYQVSVPAEHLKRAIELSLSPPSDTPLSMIHFHYEAVLRDHLADDPSQLERGMVIYEGTQGRGVEFRVGSRFIDILALDAHKNLAVVELKLSRGYDRVIGQLLSYVAWVEQHIAKRGQKVRGLIVAREITPELKLACSKIPFVELVTYSVDVKITKCAKTPKTA
jgi:hypothetical protein